MAEKGMMPTMPLSAIRIPYTMPYAYTLAP